MPVSGTTIVSSSDVLEAQVEKVRGSVQELFETSDTLASRIKKSGEVETISEKLYRMPLVKFFGGTYGKFDANGGDMGSGSGPSVTKMTAGFVYSRYTFELSQQSMDTSANADQSKLNTFSYVFKGAMKQLQKYDDICFHTDGTGKLTAGASTGSANSLTFAGTTDTTGVTLLAPGMSVLVYDSSASGYMGSGATYQISTINYGTKTVTFTANLGATGASGDYIVFAGISDNPPVSFQSGYPASSLTADSFRHGLYYFNDYTSSNYCLGVLKSSLPELLPASYDGASSTVVWQYGQLVRDQLIQRRDPEMYNALEGFAHQAQRAAIQNIGTIISNWNRTGGEKSLDVAPSNLGADDSFDFAGFKMNVDKRQKTDRLDFINPARFGRAQLFDTRFHEVGGKTIFESRTPNGTLKAAQHFHIVQAYDYFSPDPGCAAIIYGLAVPSGY